MIKYENGCVDCGLPCMGKTCKHFKIPVYYCDRCNLEIQGAVYEKDGTHLCESCMIETAKENIEEIFEECEDEILDLLGFVKER